MYRAPGPWEKAEATGDDYCMLRSAMPGIHAVRYEKCGSDSEREVDRCALGPVARVCMQSQSARYEPKTKRIDTASTLANLQGSATSTC